MEVEFTLVFSKILFFFLVRDDSLLLTVKILSNSESYILPVLQVSIVKMSSKCGISHKSSQIALHSIEKGRVQWLVKDSDREPFRVTSCHL